MNTTLNVIEVFPWNINFETGVQEIDEQHKLLVQLLNRLAKNLVEEKNLNIDQVFSELADYATFHFESEERIWAQYFKDDPWLNTHHLSHASFLPRATELMENFSDCTTQQKLGNIVKFLIRWLAFHIIDDDKRMAFVIEEIDSGKSITDAKSAAENRMGGATHTLIEAVLKLHDELSSRTFELMQECHDRKKAVEELRIANLKLEALTITDTLSGLYNRRHFDNCFSKELRRAKRDNNPLSLIMLDIDFFKKLNDNYGHSQGDQAIAKLGSALNKLCRRPADMAFRIGGEEFALITTGLSPDEADRYVELIRNEIINLNIPHGFSEVANCVTVSIGLVTVINTGNLTTDTICKIADDNLYKAKRTGRNRAVSSTL